MTAVPRSFWILLACIWAGGFAAARIVAQDKSIPWGLAVAVLPAFLVELSLYAAQAYETLRQQIPQAAVGLSGAVVYAILAAPVGMFSWISFLTLAAGGLVLVFWFRIWPRSVAADIGFAALMAAPVLFKLFSQYYPRPHEVLRMEFLGQLFWIRAGVASVLNERPQKGINFGFLPAVGEWKTGVICYALLLPLVLAGAALTGFARFAWPELAVGRLLLTAIATFAGILWVVALSEEFFFRGLLQQWFEQWTGNAWAGLLAASLLFGAAHLGFRQFPNWRFALLAGLAGIFYGLAFRRGHGIRAAMVCHALTVTTWRLLFR